MACSSLVITIMQSSDSFVKHSSTKCITYCQNVISVRVNENVHNEWINKSNSNCRHNWTLNLEYVSIHESQDQVLAHRLSRLPQEANHVHGLTSRWLDKGYIYIYVVVLHCGNRPAVIPRTIHPANVLTCYYLKYIQGRTRN